MESGLDKEETAQREPAPEEAKTIEGSSEAIRKEVGIDQAFFENLEKRIASIKAEGNKGISFWNISPEPDKKPWLTIDEVKFFQEQIAKAPENFLTSEELVKKIKFRFNNEQNFKRAFSGLSQSIGDQLQEMKTEFLKAFDQICEKIQSSIQPKTQWETILTSFNEKKLIDEDDQKLLGFVDVLSSLLAQNELKAAENRVEGALESIKATIKGSQEVILKGISKIEGIDFNDFRIMVPLNDGPEPSPPKKFIVEKKMEEAVASRICWGTRGISVNDKKGLYLSMGWSGETYLRRLRDDKLIRSGKFDIGGFFSYSTWSTVAWDPTETRFAIAGSYTKNLYIVSEKFEVEKYLELKTPGAIWMMVWWDADHIVTGHENGLLVLYQMSTNSKISTEKVCGYNIIFLLVFVDSDGQKKLGASSTNGDIFIYKISEEGVIEKVEELLQVVECNWINHFSFSPKFDRIAVAPYEKKIKMVERSSKKALWTYNSNVYSESYRVEWSPKGTYLVVNEYTPTRPFYVLDSARGTLLFPVENLWQWLPEPTYSFAFLWDEMSIIIGNRAGMICRIRMSSE